MPETAGPADYFFWTDGRQIGAVRSLPQLSMNSRQRTICKYSPTMPCFPPPSLQQQRDNIWWLFRHFSTFSPEFCLPDKAMIFNRGLIEPSHVLLWPTQLAHRQPHRVRHHLSCIDKKKRHWEEKIRVRDWGKKRGRLRLCCGEWSLRWVERVCQLSRLAAQKGKGDWTICESRSTSSLGWDCPASLKIKVKAVWGGRKDYFGTFERNTNEFCSRLRQMLNRFRKSQQKGEKGIKIQSKLAPCQLSSSPSCAKWRWCRWGWSDDRQSRPLLIPHQPRPAPLPCHHNNNNIILVLFDVIVIPAIIPLVP